MANYHGGGMYGMAAVWREPESPQLSLMSGCSSLFIFGLHLLDIDMEIKSVQAYVEELEKEVRRLVDDNLKLKKQCKELKQEVAALVLPTKSSLRRTSSTEF
uniref:Uncharacterized protein n=1 Tax=Avena sativa TaxID=4498 RepID=A0ACD5UJ77_AVESA